MSAATIASGALEVTVGQLGDQAEQVVRALTHRTRPGLGALSDPADAADVVGALARLAAGLPQLTAQLASWAVSEQQAGRLRVDACPPPPDPAAAVAEAVTEAIATLAQAARGAHAAGRALDAAHQILTHLAAAAPAGHDRGLGGRP